MIKYDLKLEYNAVEVRVIITILQMHNVLCFTIHIFYLEVFLLKLRHFHLLQLIPYFC